MRNKDKMDKMVGKLIVRITLIWAAITVWAYAVGKSGCRP